MSNVKAKFFPGIRFTVVFAFAMATVLTAILALGLQYYFGQSLAKAAARNLYTLTSKSVASEIRNMSSRNVGIVELLAKNPALDPGADEEIQVQMFKAILAKNPLHYGVYVGHGNGVFLELINLDANAAARTSVGAGPEDHWLLVRVGTEEGGSRQRDFIYYDEKFEVRHKRSEPTDFNLLIRSWYTRAMISNSAQRSAPYFFAQLGVAGQTLSMRLGDTNTVIGIDTTLGMVSNFLAEHSIAQYGELFLYNGAGEVIASSIESPQSTKNTASGKPLLALLGIRPPLDRLEKTRMEGKEYYVYATELEYNDTGHLYFGVKVPEDTVVGPFLEYVKLSIAITAGFLLLLLPMSWVFATPIVRPIKQLALENDKVRERRYDDVDQVTSNIKELDELSESMVAMVDAIRAHEKAQRALMDSFIQLIAQAIDDKSAYTGGHCARVPVLAQMLAEEASNSNTPEFESFKLETEDQWREYKIAAWLHDCGKITTPEHIVDKGSKLETIYNRIHEVRMRFEVLHRDAEIEYWKALCVSPDQKNTLSRELKSQQAQLQDDFEFVASCNVGGEFLDPQKQERLRSIGAKVWRRYFDDRLGLSPVEELRVSGGTASLPAEEYLLADKPEHLIQRDGPNHYAPELGINMDIPEHLYNQGEIYNLSISKGTLTPEDRFKINEHMISTIKMLGSLPFPAELKNVPRYASTHHETMSGKGYPRKLTGDQLSIPERILAVADIFEALTASDRPYKKAKPISVAVDILHKMVLDNHIDKDCFELFVRNKVYLAYAREYLRAEQIDEVDVSRYV